MSRRAGHQALPGLRDIEAVARAALDTGQAQRRLHGVLHTPCTHRCEDRTAATPAASTASPAATVSAQLQSRSARCRPCWLCRAAKRRRARRPRPRNRQGARRYSASTATLRLGQFQDDRRDLRRAATVPRRRSCGNRPAGTGRLPAAYLTPGAPRSPTSSAAHAPELLPGRRTPPATRGDDRGAARHHDRRRSVPPTASSWPATAGPRRATSSPSATSRRSSRPTTTRGVAIAGAAGPADRDGQAVPGPARALREGRGRDALASRARPTSSRRWSAATSAMAMQGLAVVPLFAGYDLTRRAPGRLFSYDVTGGRYEEHQVPLGRVRLAVRPRRVKKLLARRLHRPTTPSLCAVQALYDAADEDSATGGPDLIRRIFPVVVHHHRRRLPALADDEVGAIVDAVVAGADGATPAARRRRCDDPPTRSSAPDAPTTQESPS